jgi:PAS domain S-box-containing protein
MSILPSAVIEPGSNPVVAAPPALASVLVIDDEEIVCSTLKALLKAEGFDVVTALSGEEGVELLRGRQFEVAIADLVMSGMDGIQTIAALKEVDPNVEVIILTGYATVKSTIAALRQGACDFLLKPIGMAQLRPALMRGLERRRPNAALPLYEGSRTVLATLNREDLIPAALDLAEHTLRASAAALALVPSEGTGLHIDLSKDDGPLTKAAVQSLAQQAIEARVPLCDPSFVAGHSKREAAAVPAGSVLTYPLEVGNAMLGALVLWRDQGMAQFSAIDGQQGRLLADEIVIALDNARLYRELSHKVEELETAKGEVVRAEACARAVIDTAREAIVLFTREGVVRDFNPLAEQTFGWSREQAVGRNLADFAIPPRLLEAFRRHLETAYREGKDPLNGCLEVYGLRPNGEEFPFEISTAVIETPQGKLLSTFGRDITERKQAEQSLREAEEQFRSLFASIPLPIFFWDVETLQYLEVNDAAVLHSGYSRDELLKMRVTDLLPPEHAPAILSKMQVVRTQSRDRGQGRHRRKDGRVVDVEVDAYALDFRGRRATLAVIQDITERKRAEKALRESEEKYRALIETTGTGFVIIDMEGRVLDANAEYVRLTGRGTLEETLGRRVTEWTAQHDLARNAEEVRKCVERGFVRNLEIDHVNKDGGCTPIEVNATLLPSAAGARIVTLCRDITERKRAAAEMAEQHRLAALVAEVGVALTGAESLRQGLQQCAEILVREIDAAFARVWTVNEAENVLELQASAGMYTHIDGGHARVPMGKFKIGHIAESGEPHLTNTVREDSWVGDPEWARREGMVAFAGYPLKVEERVLGVVVAFARKTLTEATLQAFASVAHNLAQFIKRKRAEEALRESEERYRLLFERNLAGVFRGTLLSRRVLDCNDAYARMLGYDSRQEVLSGGKLHAFYDPTEFEIAKTRLLNEKALTNAEVRFCHKDQAPVWVLANVSLIEARKGEEPLVEGTLFNITKRKQAEQALAYERDLLRALMDNLPDYIYFKDRQSRFLRTNTALAKGFGLSDPGQAVGKTDFDFFTAEHAQAAYDDEQEVIRTGTPMVAKEEKETWPDGWVTWASTTKMPLRDASGNIVGTFGISRDITERKQAEEALRDNEEKYRVLYESSRDAIMMLAPPEWAFTAGNPAAIALFGARDEQELVAAAPWTLSPEYQPDGELSSVKAPQMIEAAMKTGSNLFEWTHKKFSGEEFFATVTLTRMIYRGQLLLQATVRDITERKRAEQQTHLLTTALESAANGILIANHEGRILWANPAFTRLSGYSAAEVVGQNPRVWKSGAQDAAFYQKLWKTVLSGEVWQGEIVNRRKDGSVYTEGMTITPVRDALGTVSHFIAIKEDISGRKHAEEALRASEERYRELFENASDLVFTADLDLRLTSLNRVAEQTIGYSREEAAQMNLRQLVDPKHWQRMEHASERLLTGESAVQLEVEITAKDGRRVMLEVKPRLIYKDGKPVGVQGIGRDITGREVVEMELRHAQKLESVGRLASGIAHEINTPIQFVGDNTHFLQDCFGGLQTLLTKYQELRDAADSGAVSPELLAEVRDVEEASDCAYLLEEIPRALTQTLEGVTRVATIVRAMKEFAHPESKEMAAADLNRALLSTLTVARNELKYVADVETEFGDLPLVVCNIGDLNQVFLNLLVNAAHAIAESVKGTGQKGKIRIRTVSEGSTVLVTISDTGCGIPEANRTKVFDPFFTTKEVGRGTGQGLAIARSVVVERHKGTLTFESEVGKGTTFYIRLPVDRGECSKETRVP